MAFYLTFGEFQSYMNEYYRSTGKRLQFPEMTSRLKKKGLLHDYLPSPELKEDYSNLTDEEFDHNVVDLLPITLTLQDGIPLPSLVSEEDMFPSMRDVFVIRHPRFTRPAPHRHNYFEIDYVVKGKGKFLFEKKEEHVMQDGELCIIAPDSVHDFLIEDDSSIVFTICLRKSTFETTFYSVMSRNDLLSCFFRTVLQGNSHANYLMFFTRNNSLLKQCVRSMIVECHKMDIYSNSCCISYTNLMFSSLLRTYSQTVQFYNYEMGTNFSLILQYIQHNYKTLTLSSLAEFFHYSEPYLSKLIRQNTGYTFTELVKRLRMSDAAYYLLHTDMKISEIAEKIGYHSADHFSRVFTSYYNMAPQEYRKTHWESSDLLVPFYADPVPAAQAT